MRRRLRRCPRATRSTSESYRTFLGAAAGVTVGDACIAVAAGVTVGAVSTAGEVGSVLENMLTGAEVLLRQHRFSLMKWGGYRLATAIGGVTPYAALQAQNFRMPSYNETDVTGGGFALSYNSQTSTDTRSELGVRFDHAAMVGPDATLILRGRLAWAHDWVTDPTLMPVFQALPGSSFIVNGAAPTENSALVSAGAELRLASGVALLGKFNGEFASHSQTYAGTAEIRYTW